MAYDQDNHSRRSVRLRDYDYAGQGAYFVTFCVHQKECILGEIVLIDSVGAHSRAPRPSAMAHGMTDNACMKLSDFGKIVQDEWRRSASIRSAIELDAFVVMPNHVHGIILITEGGAYGRPLGRAHICAPLQPHWFHRKPRSLGSFIAGFKSSTTKRINIIRGTPGQPAWQRNYYERVIRNEAELHAIRRYIADNPRQWHLDRENPRSL